MQKGFTLLELLLAISLMAVLSITTTQMLRKTTTQTKKLTDGLDHINHLRSTVNIIKKDVAKAINYRDLNLFLYNEAQEERAARRKKNIEEWIKEYNKKNNPNPAVTEQTLNDAQREEMLKVVGPVPPTTEELKKEVIFTHFVGDSEKVYFTSTSGVRFRSTDKISDLLEVGYFLRTCKSRKIKDYESKCLWRSVSYNIDDDVTKGGKESVLIENIRSAEFKYLSFQDTNVAKDSVDWVEFWDSRNDSDTRTGGKFPAAVSIELEIEIPNKKNKRKPRIERLTGTFEIDFANNDPFAKIKSSTASTSSGTGATTPAPTQPGPGGL